VGVKFAHKNCEISENMTRNFCIVIIIIMAIISKNKLCIVLGTVCSIVPAYVIATGNDDTPTVVYLFAIMCLIIVQLLTIYFTLGAYKFVISKL
jgi:hypothetical protein